MPNTDPDWLTAIGTLILAFFTFVLAVVAVLQDRIRGWLLRPKLSASIATAPPDCHKTQMGTYASATRADTYYFRLRVKNSGNQRAELVEVFAAELHKQQADGKFKKQAWFLPMNLCWSHTGRTFFDAISPGMEKHCDLGHVIEPAKRSGFAGEDNLALEVPQDKTLFSLDLEVKPFALRHLLPPGNYRLVLQIAAANTKPIRKTMEIKHIGIWYTDEKKMLDEGISLQIL